MTGATQLIAASSDDGASALTSIGFDFLFNGTTYTQFSANANGFLRLGALTTTGSTYYSNSLTNAAAGAPAIMPYWDDLATGVGGQVRSLLLNTGAFSAPNRRLVVEWYVTVPRNTTGNANATFQCWLDESTNVITFVYGAGMLANTANSGYSIGLCNATSQYINVNSVTNESSTTSFLTSTTAAIASPRYYRFAPPPSCAGTPNAGAITGTTTPACGTSGSSRTLTYADNNPGVGGITWQWQSSLAPFTTWNNVGTINSATYSTGSITATTHYRVVVTCTASALTANSTEFVYPLNPTPTVAVTPATASTCGAVPTVLTATGATTYAWAPATELSATTGDVVTASPTTTRTYTVTGTLDGCTGTASSTITIVSTPVIQSVTSTPAVICAGSNSQLNVVATSTSPYVVSPVAYAPITGSGTAITTWTGGTGTTGADDGFSTAITLPFSFNFYGTAYTQLWVGTNGYITFLAPGSMTGANSRAAANINSSTEPNGMVALNISDLNVATPGVISTFASGSPGNQVFVIDFTAVPFYGSPNTGNVTGQIHLHEVGGVVEIHVNQIDHGTSTALNAMGVENAAGTARTIPPGRGSATLWNVSSPEAWRFAPEQITYQWNADPLLSSTTIPNPIATNVTSSSTFVVTATSVSTGCQLSASAFVEVGAGAPPEATISAATTTTFCAGGSVVLNGATTGGCAPLSYSWSNGTTVVGNTLNYTATASGSYTLTVTDNSSQTDVSDPIVVTVNPLPTAIASSNSPICEGGALALSATSNTGTTFAWTGPDGFTSTTQNPTISSITTAKAGIYSVIASDANCSSTPGTTTVMVGATTSPISITPASASICPGSSIALTASGGSANTTVVSGAGGTTTVGNTTASTLGPNPLQSYYGNTKLQMMWTAAELSAMGLSSGASINSIAFNMATVESTRSYSNFRIKVQQSAAVTSLSSIVSTGWTTVYGPQTVSAAVGYNTFTFTSPLVWDGTSNVIVEFNHRNNDSGGSGTATAKYDLGLTYTAANFYRVDGTTTDMDAYTGTPTNTYLGRAQVRFGAVLGGGTYTWSPAGGLNTTTGASVVASPTAETTYTATYTRLGCSSTATALVEIGTPTPPTANITAGGATSFCSGGSVLLSSTVVGGCAPLTYSWSDGTTVVGTNADLTVNTSGTYTLTVTDFAAQVVSSNSIAVTVNPNPTAIANNSGPICAGADLHLSATSDIGTSFSWAGPGGYTSTEQNPTISGATTGGNYQVTVSNGTCTSTGSTIVVINPLPANVTATSSSTLVCAGSSVDLSVSHAPNLVPILSEGFNGAAADWTTSNTSTGTNPAAGAWTLRPNGYQNTGGTTVYTFNSNDASQFYMTNSDAIGSGASGNTTLTSPAFSTMGYTSASMTYYHHFRPLTATIATIEVSTDNTTWTVVKTYNNAGGVIGTSTAFALETVDLTSVIGHASVKVRFHYVSGWDWFWAIDNVTISGGTPLSIAWTSSPVGFTSAAQNPTGVVVNTTTTYSATVTSTAGCSASSSVQVVANQPVSAGTSSTSTLCNVDPSVELISLLGGTPNSGGSWTDPHGDSHSGQINPALDIAGTYTYTVTAVAPCTNATATVNVTINTATVFYADTDGDGYGDPNSPTAACGQPVGYVANQLDNCPGDGLKRDPGVCGCGTADTDSDGDGIADCNDHCPLVAGTVGSPCNDGDPNTVGDVLTSDCLCAGTVVAPCSQNTVALVLSTDANGGQTSWEIIPQGGGAALCNGNGYANNTSITVACCLANGCYELRVLDSFGDGMTTGGYLLLDANNKRIIDNSSNGAGFTTVSQVANAGGFCVPLGTDGMLASSCDQMNLLSTSILQAQANPAVSAQWLVGNQTDDGYQFWIFDPNGGYSRRILISHATTTTGGPYGATRATYLNLSTIVTLPVPQFKLLNIKVRSLVNGVYGQFGAACRMRINPVVDCATTQLASTSCGATSVPFPGGTIQADNVNGATRYQFEFTAPGFNRLIASPTRALSMSWVTMPLTCGTTYNVRVRVSFNGGASYCTYGSSCTVTTFACARPALADGNGANTRSISENGFDLWPNPNRGDLVNLRIASFDAPVENVMVDVMDLYGKRVMGKNIAVSNGALNSVFELEELANGVYLVHITAGEQTFVKRMVVQK